MAARQIDHPAWGHSLNLGPAFIRSRGPPEERALEKCMNFCEISARRGSFLVSTDRIKAASTCVNEWARLCQCIEERKERKKKKSTRLDIWNQCFNPAREPYPWKPHDPGPRFTLETERCGDKVFWLKSLFVRQTVELAHTDARPDRPMTRVSTLPLSQTHKKYWHLEADFPLFLEDASPV